MARYAPVHPGKSSPHGRRPNYVAWMTLALALALMAASAYSWYAHAGQASSRVGALAVGKPLPDVALWGERGEVGLHSTLLSSGLTLIVFYTPTCEVCPEELRALLDWMDKNPEAPLRVAVVADEHAKPSRFPAYPGRLVWLRDPGLRESRHRLRIGAVPSYAVVDDGKIIRYVQRGMKVRAGENVLLAELGRLIDHWEGEAHGH